MSLDDEEEGRRVDVVDTSPSADPGHVLASNRLGQRLRLAMDELTSQERAAFVMRHYEGLSIDEIGHALDLGASAAKHSIFRAVRKLRAAMVVATGSV